MPISLSSLPDLPIKDKLEEIRAAARQARFVVVEAEPGAGKTSLLPLALLGAAQDPKEPGGGKVAVLEPRRLACRQAASRMARLLGQELGQEVGYSLRGESRVSGKTKIEVMTEGLFIRRIQDDPGLAGLSYLVFDEFHERSIDADLGLALALDSMALGAGFSIVIMSATLDGQTLCAFLSERDLGPVRHFRVPGRGFPVQRHYRPLACLASGPRPARQDLAREGATAIADVYREEKGDILCFLPGIGEILALRDALPGRLAGAGAPAIKILHGAQDLTEQSELLSPGGDGERRIILSTNIAQTSLTIPGLSAVVDFGLAKVLRYRPNSGMDELLCEYESQSDADQRAGRAGRLGPGRAYRLFPEGLSLRPRAEAEIQRADLARLLLETRLWGAARPGDLSFMDEAPAAALARAEELLAQLGLVDEAGRVQPLGREAARLGLGPRLGAMLIRAPTQLAVASAALLQDRDRSGIGGDADFAHRLRALGRGEGSSSWLSPLMAERRRLSKLMGLAESPWSAGSEESAGDALIWGFPDRLAHWDRDSGQYRFASGKAARLWRLAKDAHSGSLEAREWIVALDATPGEGLGLIHLAAGVSVEAARDFCRPRARMRALVEWRALKPRYEQRPFLGRLALPLSFGQGRDGPEDQARLSREAIGQSLMDRLRQEGLGILPWADASFSLLERARHFGLYCPRDGFPALDEASLIGGAEEWLFPFCQWSCRDDVILQEGLGSALAQLILPWRSELEREAPASLSLAKGCKRRLIYGQGEKVVLESRLQDFFGMVSQPMVCGRPVLIRLLSPAGRPVQTTEDIGGFWRSSYAEVRRELRGRYPRHSWPEDPSALS